MEKFLFMINSTSMFYQNSKNKVGKLEIPYLIPILCFCLIGVFLGNEGARGINFGSNSTYASLLFIIYGVQWVLYSASGIKADVELQKHFWKTQMWRFLDPAYNWQKSLFPNAPEQLVIWKSRWKDEYGMTPEETKLFAPFFQKGWVVVVTGIVGIILTTILSYFITMIFI